MIPRIVHFIYFGLEARETHFPLVYYLAVRSAFECIKPDVIYFHNSIKPAGPYWDALEPLVTRVERQAPTEVFGRPLAHFAHKADVVRLQALCETGGIYLDIDTICRRSFDDLLHHPCVMGGMRLVDGKPGLCNAVFLSEPKNTFVEEWRQTYRTFRSKGRDKYWDEHSVRIPWKLARMTRAGRSKRTDLHVEPVESFFKPGFWGEEIHDLFEHDVDFPRTYCHHLWETYSYKPYLQHLTEEFIREVDTTYNRVARQFLPNVAIAGRTARR